ncbi:hypothetical protein ACUXZZ_32845 [Streptomyces graminifolii]|uniref:hypothetical protein n=1 Tax=Streptomyces graminifolii TaxID=1266771 RepID=UPI00405912D3
MRDVEAVLQVEVVIDQDDVGGRLPGLGETLDEAAKRIDQDIAAHGGYPPNTP